VGARWLREWCARAGGGAGGAGADDSVALAVARVLLSRAPGEEAAAELFDLLGDATDMDAVQELLALRCAPRADRPFAPWLGLGLG
jgi:hypothetical protein